MRILLVEVHHNGAGLATRLVRHSSEHQVILVTSAATPVGCTSDDVQVVEFAGAVTDLVELAQREKVDLVVNYNPVYGVSGLCEALTKVKIPVVGANQGLSGTEIYKQQFKSWLVEHSFQTPQTLYRGRYDDVRRRGDSFTYPVVVKPDMQSGPAVGVCDNAEALGSYLATAVERVPYAKFGVVYSVEEYVPIAEHFHVGYFLCGGRAHVDWAVRVSSLREGRRLPDEAECVVLRHPKNRRYMSEIERFTQAMIEFADGALATVQCGIAPDGALYFIEHNARPGTNSGALTAFPDPITGLRCLQHGDRGVLARHMVPIDQGIMIGISLLPQADVVEIDVDALSQLPGAQYFPRVLARRGQRYVSIRQGAPIILTFEGDTPDDVVSQVHRTLPTIARTGDFLPVNLTTVRRIVEG